MAKMDLHSRLTRKGANPARLADLVIEHPETLSQLLAGWDSEQTSLKYTSAKVLRMLSLKEPDLLYPNVDFFIDRLHGENSILRWEAIRVVGNLARVDARDRVDQILDVYLEPIRGPVMITAATTIESAATIALAKPRLAAVITRAILKVEYGNYQTEECRNVALGHAIEALDRMFAVVDPLAEVFEFVRRQTDNPRNSTRKKAAAFLQHHPEADR